MGSSALTAVVQNIVSSGTVSKKPFNAVTAELKQH
jgi:hypothetical protein